MYKRAARLALFLVCPVSSSGCDATSPSVVPSVRDSLGVRIVDHGELDSAALPQWSLGSDPMVSIGVVDGDDADLLYGVLDAHRRRDGSIAIVDRSRALRVFDSLGAHVWTAGRRGDGPGEFGFPQMVTEISGDSIVVWDVMHRRLTGRRVRSRDLRRASGVCGSIRRVLVWRYEGLRSPSRNRFWGGNRPALDGS